jgi:hypothetical protein
VRFNPPVRLPRPELTARPRVGPSRTARCRCP